MNNFIKRVIEEKFESKKQQRFFYAKANDKSIPKKERKKWDKWAKEFSDKTDFKKIPDKVEKEVDEIVDKFGNIKIGNKPPNLLSKGTTSNLTSDEVVKTGGGSMGIHGVHGTHTSLRYWAESDLSKSLGYDDTMAKDEDYEDAKDHFKDELGLDEPETEDRLSQMGYDKNLEDDKVRLIENPKSYIEEYLDELLSKKSGNNDIVKKNEREIHPIIVKQIKSLKNSLDSHGLSVEDIINLLKNNE